MARVIQPKAHWRTAREIENIPGFCPVRLHDISTLVSSAVSRECKTQVHVFLIWLERIQSLRDFIARKPKKRTRSLQTQIVSFFSEHVVLHGINLTDSPVVPPVSSHEGFKCTEASATDQTGDAIISGMQNARLKYSPGSSIVSRGLQTRLLTCHQAHHSDHQGSLVLMTWR